MRRGPQQAAGRPLASTPRDAMPQSPSAKQCATLAVADESRKWTTPEGLLAVLVRVTLMLDTVEFGPMPQRYRGRCASTRSAFSTGARASLRLDMCMYLLYERPPPPCLSGACDYSAPAPAAPRASPPMSPPAWAPHHPHISTARAVLVDHCCWWWITRPWEPRPAPP